MRQDFRQAKPINFQQRPSGIVFYCFELYAIGLRRLATDGPSYELAQKQLAEAVAWMNEHPIKQAPGDWETFDIHTDMAGLPYLKFIFAREFSQYRQLSTTADEDLARISAWLFSRGDPPVSQLIPWEVMSWGMLSLAERLSPGFLARLVQPADSKGQFPGVASASTTAPNSSADGAIDGDRFGLRPGTFWKGADGAKTWWWQLRFAEPRPVGAILQVHGDQPSILSGAPSRYRWQSSLDGRTWQDLQQTESPPPGRHPPANAMVNAYSLPSANHS